MIVMCHIVFVHSPVDGHLSWPYILAIVNSIAVDTDVKVIRIFIYLEMIWLDYMIVLGTSILASIMAE